jgi:hypothetical protein
LFDRDALESLVEYPAIAPRVFSSFALRGRVVEMVELFAEYVGQGESLFEGTEAQFFDALLVGDPSRSGERKALELVERFLDGSLGASSGGELGKSSAILAYYWLGGNVGDLAALLSSVGWSRVSTQVARPFLAALAATAPSQFQAHAIQFVGHPSDDVGRIVEFSNAIVTGKFAKPPFPYAHLKPRWPLAGKRYDARAWLQLELLSRSTHTSVGAWLKAEVARFAKYARTRQEKRVLGRIRKRVKP